MNLSTKSLRVIPGFVVAALVAIVASASAMAAAPFQEKQAPGFYRMKVGDFEVTTIYDGDAWLDMKLLHADMNDIAVLLKRDFSEAERYKGYVSVFLINTGKNLVLVDTGTGGHWTAFPTLGRMTANLRAAGYAPEQVDTVLLTHLHPDHVPGLTKLDGSRAFPNAKVYMAKAESDFWLSKDTMSKAPLPFQEFFKLAQDGAVPYLASKQWIPFEGTAEIVPGVRPVPIAGHTPGHSGYEFTSKGQSLLIWGDVVHVVPVQVPRPDVTIAFDGDADVAGKSRQSLFESLAAKGALIGGPHMPFPALGHLRKDGSTFTWVPVLYSDNP